MAYNKVSNKSQDKDVKYLSKDFNDFKSQLLDFATTYYPDTHKDFSEGSPGEKKRDEIAEAIKRKSKKN